MANGTEKDCGASGRASERRRRRNTKKCPETQESTAGQLPSLIQWDRQTRDADTEPHTRQHSTQRTLLLRTPLCPPCLLPGIRVCVCVQWSLARRRRWLAEVGRAGGRWSCSCSKCRAKKRPLQRFKPPSKDRGDRGTQPEQGEGGWRMDGRAHTSMCVPCSFVSLLLSLQLCACLPDGCSPTAARAPVSRFPRDCRLAAAVRSHSQSLIPHAHHARRLEELHGDDTDDEEGECPSVPAKHCRFGLPFACAAAPTPRVTITQESVMSNDDTCNTRRSTYHLNDVACNWLLAHPCISCVDPSHLLTGPAKQTRVSHCDTRSSLLRHQRHVQCRALNQPDSIADAERRHIYYGPGPRPGSALWTAACGRHSDRRRRGRTPSCGGSCMHVLDRRSRGHLLLSAAP